MLIKCNESDDLKQAYKNFIKKADAYKKASKGMINYYKTHYDSKQVRDAMQLYTRDHVHQDLHDLEHEPLNEAYHGGIHYANVGEYKNCYDYDKNECYTSYLTNGNFKYPTNQPIFQVMPTVELLD